ncbi:spore germination protein GerPC [Lentibacillus sp.]|uniref:spore germination protein GerPC n=1 Tax=Lentibacillus sp. TaxID=1925746 RepID=UPI002B4B2F7F|nr:spore germination protein GerPC [Lentibacillus sp.]HLS09668.1 spore germination protein GerPC [Lentibacillus sp.]
MNGWNQYMYNLYQRIDKQDRIIESLETRLQQLENNHNSHQSRQTVEKIEYHFDQLKIENLDGTLHIGLTPDDLNNIEDLSVPDTENTTIKQQLLPDLNTYLNENGEQLIRDLAARNQVSMDKIDPDILLQDMAKQLPERIAHYEAEAGHNRQAMNVDQLKSHISDRIKHEIYHSLDKYLKGIEQNNEYGSP